MSRSDSPAASGIVDTAAGGQAVGERAARLVDLLEQLADTGAVSAEQVRAIVGATIRLYAGASERAGHELPPVNADVTTTDALTLACALVRSQDLTPFEMAVWFSRGRRPE